MTTLPFLRRLWSTPAAARSQFSTVVRNISYTVAHSRSVRGYTDIGRRPWSLSTQGAYTYVHVAPATPSAGRQFSTSGYRLREDQDEPGSASVPVSGTLPPEHLNEREAGIFVKLAEKLSPSRLDVRDISGGCGSMYAVEIESPLFRGLTTLKMHRQVQDVLAEEIKGWHGIQLKTKATPVEG